MFCPSYILKFNTVRCGNRNGSRLSEKKQSWRWRNIFR